uniref:Uncharacterized protein n=1 Tax=Fagus sylvatica TaxID=28930 RepID=A0A2N9EF19_FAGSY
MANGCDPKMMAQSHVIGFLWLALLLALGQASKFFCLIGLWKIYWLRKSFGWLRRSTGLIRGRIDWLRESALHCSDLMVTCDGFYDDGLTVTLRGGMTWSEFQAFPMDGDKSLKGHLASFQGSLIPPFKEMEELVAGFMGKVQAWSVVRILVAEKGSMGFSSKFVSQLGCAIFGSSEKPFFVAMVEGLPNVRIELSWVVGKLVKSTFECQWPCMIWSLS